MQSTDESVHPVEDALWRAVYETMARLRSLLVQFPRVPPPAMKESANCVVQLANEINELTGWLYPPREPMALPQLFQCREQLITLGFPDRSGFMEKFLSDLQRRDRGRPHQHVRYVAAFELMLESAQWSLGKVTRRFCDCGSQGHSEKCRRHFQDGIRDLKRLLSKYAPELVARYDGLHPNRAEK